MASLLDTAVRPDGNGARIVLTGSIDRDGDEAMTRAYAQAYELGHGEIVLDFAATDYINSTGIALIVRLLAQARRDGRPVRASGLSDHYREIFRITRLSDFITLEGDATENGATDLPTEQVGGSR
jgi:anti-anti-sigma factor